MNRIAAMVFMCASVALAGQIPNSEHIYVGSAATIKVVPDMATLQMTVQATDVDGAKAKAVVDERSAKIIALAKKTGITNQDITASQVGIEPDYDWQEKARVYRGTSVKREVTVVLRDLTKYTDLVQGLAEVPVSSLGDTKMGVVRNEEVQAEALAKAIEGAKVKARKIAGQFGAQLGDVYSISETEMHYDEADRMFCAMASADYQRGAFEPGTIDITARIYVVFRIQPKK